jgi:hypothetical protein
MAKPKSPPSANTSPAFHPAHHLHAPDRFAFHAFPRALACLHASHQRRLRYGGQVHQRIGDADLWPACGEWHSEATHGQDCRIRFRIARHRQSNRYQHRHRQVGRRYSSRQKKMSSAAKERKPRSRYSKAQRAFSADSTNIYRSTTTSIAKCLSRATAPLQAPHGARPLRSGFRGLYRFE